MIEQDIEQYLIGKLLSKYIATKYGLTPDATMREIAAVVDRKKKEHWGDTMTIGTDRIVEDLPDHYIDHELIDANWRDSARNFGCLNLTDAEIMKQVKARLLFEAKEKKKAKHRHMLNTAWRGKGVKVPESWFWNKAKINSPRLSDVSK